MRNYYVIDIETIPDQTIPRDCLPQLDPEDVKYGNTKDRFKREEILQAAIEKFNAGLDRKMSVDPDMCQICCVCGMFHGGGDGHAYSVANCDDEVDVLERVWDIISKCYRDGIPLVSFNGVGFDLPILLRRAILLDISVSPAMAANLLKAYDNQYHYDVMRLLGHRNAFSGKFEFHSLNYYLKRFQIGAKLSEWDGSKVYPAWKEGRHQEIAEYCMDDVKKTMALFERVKPWVVVPRAEKIETIKTAA